MKEYISREAAFDAVFGQFCASSDETEAALNAAIEEIRAIPAADVRPVVLCRDCEYFSEVMYGGTQFEYGYCDRWADGTRMRPDDFCSCGVKREES